MHDPPTWIPLACLRNVSVSNGTILINALPTPSRVIFPFLRSRNVIPPVNFNLSRIVSTVVYERKVSLIRFFEYIIVWNVVESELECFTKMRNNFAKSKSKRKEGMRGGESSTVVRLETTILPAIYRRFISRNAYDRFPTKTWSSRKWIPTYLAGWYKSIPLCGTIESDFNGSA